MTDDYIDEIAVERACHGDRAVSLTRAEMTAAFTRLNNKGMSAAEIAETLGVTERSITRWRAGVRSPVARKTPTRLMAPPYSKRTTAPWQAPTHDCQPRHVQLTTRQAHVLTGICHGLTNAQIAARLGVTGDTAKTHVTRLLGVLGARDRAHAAALACTGHVQITVRDTTRSAAA